MRARTDGYVIAGRKLLAEKAGWLGEETTIEIQLYSALEWQTFDE